MGFVSRVKSFFSKPAPAPTPKSTPAPTSSSKPYWATPSPSPFTPSGSGTSTTTTTTKSSGGGGSSTISSGGTYIGGGAGQGMSIGVGGVVPQGAIKTSGSFDTIRIGGTTIGRTTGGSVVGSSSIKTPTTTEQSSVFKPKPFTGYVSTISAAPSKPKGKLEGLQYSLGQQRTKLTTKELRGEGSSFKTQASLFGVGVGSTLVGGAIGIKQLATHPFKTIKKTPEVIKSLPSQGKEFGETLRTSPALGLGQVTGNVILFKGPKLASKGVLGTSDYFRTKGVSQLTKESVIAPEYFKGQKYPLIKKGQTAGQLKSEFQPMKSLGETKPAGFTAAPSPLKGKGNIIVQKGTSELPGLYQAPKLSATFLRVSSEEKKLFTFNPLGETLRPSIFRITPTKFELIPKVGKQTKQITGFNIEATKFYGGGKLPRKFKSQVISEGGKILGYGKKYISVEFPNKRTIPGKSYIPFMKTEKEAIIPFGTELVKKGKTGFIKFEGRRIPIESFETLSGEGKQVLKPSRTFTTSEVSDLSSRSRVGSQAYFNPSNLLSISRNKGKITSSSKVFSSSSNNLLTSSSKLITKPSRDYGSGSSKGFGSIGKVYGGSYGSGYKGTSAFFIPGTPKISKSRFNLRTPRKKRSSFKLKSKIVSRQPSLWAIGENIKSTMFGRSESSGLGIRPIIISKRRRRK